MSVLIVAAHPDDEVLGCGGLIPKLITEGHDVHITIFGEGITSRYGSRDEADQAELERLHARCQRAADKLGVKDVEILDLPDNRFDSVPLLEVVQRVEALIARIEPHTIYTHHGGDLNVDHQILNRAVLTATRPTKNHPVREVYAFEIPSSTEWSFQHWTPIFTPNVFVDIAETIDVKIDAMEEYESEARAFPHPRSPDALRAIAQRWGSVVGYDAAEAFELIRSLR